MSPDLRKVQQTPTAAFFDLRGQVRGEVGRQFFFEVPRKLVEGAADDGVERLRAKRHQPDVPMQQFGV